MFPTIANSPGLLSMPASSFCDLQPEDVDFAAALSLVKDAVFIAWDTAFFEVLGPNAKVERIAAFPGEARVHEAPVYVPETGELIFSDTSAQGRLSAINVDSHEVLMLVII
jgi:gluconolactonase